MTNTTSHQPLFLFKVIKYLRFEVCKKSSDKYLFSSRHVTCILLITYYLEIIKEAKMTVKNVLYIKCSMLVFKTSHFNQVSKKILN